LLAISQQMLQDFTTAREKYFNIPLEECELTVRTTNALKSEGYIFIGDVAAKTKAQLMRIPNLGRKSVTELEDMLNNLGMTFEESGYQLWVRPDHPIKPVER
jgi:DNA-directed RNA polymerase alpha subunit